MARILLLLPLTFAAMSCSSGAETPAADGASTAVATTTSSPATTTVAETSTTSTTSTTTTTLAPPTDPISAASLSDLADRGPYPVGVATLLGADGLTVDVWYPADADPSATDSYDIRDFVPDLIRDLLTGDVDSVFTYPASRNAAPLIESQTPMVVFSHGFSGMRLQSALLTSHLASWGMVVAAPDHPSRDLVNVLGGSTSGTSQDSVEELEAARRLVLDDERFTGVDSESWTAIGHSAGGGTVARLGAAPSSDELLGLVSLAAGAPDEVQAIDVRTMFIAGALDGVVPATASAAALEIAPEGSVLWVIDQAGHNAFDDFCRFGDGAGIIGVAEASGLGPFLDAQPMLKSLGTDGCLPPAAPVVESDPAISAGVTAFLADLQGRRTFDQAETPPGSLAVEVTSL